MDVFSLIYEALQIVYTFIPQEVVIIILACLVMAIFANKSEKDIEDKYNGSTFAYESPQKGEIILAVVGAEASDISYFSNFFEGRLTESMNQLIEPEREKNKSLMNFVLK